jgi:hypothetical protein
VQTWYTSYVTPDALDGTRPVTGRRQEVKGKFDYLPFGEEAYASRAGYGGGNTKSKRRVIIQAGFSSAQP